MAKLQTPSKPGFNAGDSYNVKYIRIDKIIIDPEISKIFKPDEKVVNEICESIKKDEFHKEEPLTLWAGHLILVDGHQRYYAAKKAGIDEVPYIEKNFESREAASFYTFERQVVRRNLTGADILFVAEKIPDTRSKNGEGRAAVELAKRIGVGGTTMYQAKAILKDASEEDIQNIKDGKTSIKKVYNKTKSRQPKEGKIITPSEEASLVNEEEDEIPTSTSFLKKAVILLVDKNHIPAAEILINHFFEYKNERDSFYDLLPEAVSEKFKNATLV